MEDEALADMSVLVFCVNPASAHFSAAYTEASFAALTFLGMVLLPQHQPIAVACFMAASAGRSNGAWSSPPEFLPQYGAVHGVSVGCWFLVIKGRLVTGHIHAVQES